MKSLDITKEGFMGIPADATALDGDDIRAWATTKDPSLIPLAIAMLKTGTTTAVSMSDASKAVNVGDIFTLKASLTPSTSGSETAWTQSGAGSVTLFPDPLDDRFCKVTAVKAGSVTVTATSNQKTATCAVTIS